MRAWVKQYGQWRLRNRVSADLQRAGFDRKERGAVLQTPAMWQQLRQLYTQGGRIHRVRADFSAANTSCHAQGQRVITFYVPPASVPRTHSTYAVLAHELGHALFYPQQWQALQDFRSAQDYAHAREMGEAYAWLNQYRLSLAHAAAMVSGQLQIENDHDFGVTALDVFAAIQRMEQAGADEAAILRQLAVYNANMFPCGMGAHNDKTYGQCNRWDWYVAMQPERLQQLQRSLGRAPWPNEQKLLMKYNVWHAQHGVTPQQLQTLLQQLQPLPANADLAQLWHGAQQCLPQAWCGVQSAEKT